MNDEDENISPPKTLKVTRQYYDDPNNSFKLPISSIQPSGAKQSMGDIQIPLKVFRNINDKGDHKAVIGVPILYLKNKYYLVPAYGALDSNHVHAYVRTLNHFAGQTGNNTHTNIQTNIHQEETSRKSSVRFSTHHDSIVERLSRNPRPTPAQMKESTIIGKKEGEYDKLCIIKKFQINTNLRVSNKMPGNACRISAIQRKDRESSLKDRMPAVGRHLDRGNDNSSNTEITLKKSTGPNVNLINRLLNSSNNTIYDNEHFRMKRQNRFINPQPLTPAARRKYMQFGKSLSSMDGLTSTTQNLVNKLIDTPDLPSVAEEIRLARSKAELNAMHPVQHNFATVMPKTVLGNRRTFFNLNGFPRAEQSQGYQMRGQLSETEEPMRNAFQTLGESKNLENSLNTFLQGNKKHDSDAMPESNAQQRSLQDYNDELSFQSNDRTFSMSQPYNEQENSFENSRHNNNLPYDEPDRPLSDRMKNMQDTEEMTQPSDDDASYNRPTNDRVDSYNRPTNDRVDSDYESENDIQGLEEYNMPYQSHREQSDPNNNIEENTSQLSERALNEPNIDVQRSGRKEDNIYDSPIGNSFSQSAALSHDLSTDNDLYKESPRTTPFVSERSRNIFPDNSELSNELNIDKPSTNAKSNRFYTGDSDNKLLGNQQHSTNTNSRFEQGDPKLSENIDRIQEETRSMEKEYRMLTNNKYGNSIPQYRPQNQVGNYAKQTSVELLNTNENNPLLNFKSNEFSSRNGDLENNPDLSELLREKQLFEINKFAGKEDLSVIPNIDPDRDPLLDKSPDQLLDYARQNSLHRSLKFNTQLYGIGTPNEGDNSFRSPSGMPTSEASALRSTNMDTTGLLNLMSDGIKPLVNSGRPDYTDNLGREMNYHNPAEYIANILRKGNDGIPFRNQLDVNIDAVRQYNRAKSGEQLARLHGKVPYDVEPSLADEFRNKDLIPHYNDFNNDYSTTARDQIANRKFPPGSLAAVSVGDLSSVSVIPSNVDKYKNDVFTNNPESFIRRFFQSRIPYHRNRIPRPGENMTLWNITASNITSANVTNLLKYIFNMTQSKNSNMTSRNESNFQFDEVESQFDEIVKQIKNFYEENQDDSSDNMNNIRKANTSSFNTPSEEVRGVNLLLFGAKSSNTTRIRTPNISSRNQSNKKAHQIHSHVSLEQELLRAADRNKSLQRMSSINVNDTSGSKRQVIRD